MTRSTQVAPMCLITEDADGNKAIEGRAEMFQVELPKEEARLLARMRKTTLQRERPTIIEQQKLERLKPATQAEINSRQIPKNHNEKRERMDKSELQRIVMAHFERQEFWSLKALTEVTNQPQEYLKNVLLEFCTYNKRGRNKNMYELQEQFKLAKRPSEESSDDGPSAKRLKPS